MEKNSKPTVLVVDDSLMICQQIETALKNEDMCVCVARSGQEALDMISRHMPDLILLDIILPDMEGYELLEKIRALDRNNASIVFITSKDGEQDVIRGFSMGACDYIKKPFRQEEMKSRVLAHLQTKRQRDELKKMNDDLRADMERLNNIVFRDELTGLYNRHYVAEKIETEFVESTGQDALIMVDVDNFKHINDSYGHDAGDTVLVCISSIMESICWRHRATRWGGEEFLIVLRDVTQEETMSLAEEIRNEIAEFPITYGEVTFFCTVTLGVCGYDNRISFKQNVDRADQALYRGKNSGKNCSIWMDKSDG